MPGIEDYTRVESASAITYSRASLARVDSSPKRWISFDIADALERIDSHSHWNTQWISLSWGSLKAGCAIRVVDFARTAPDA